MPTQLQYLQPIGWSLTTLPTLVNRVQVLKMPEPFQQVLASLPRSPEGVLPVASLHDTLGALSHSIIAFERFDPQSARYSRWLYTIAGSNLDLNKLRLVFNKWLLALGAPEKRIPDNAGLDFVWELIDLNQADNHLMRMVVPNLIARWLLDEDFTLKLSGQELALHFVPLMSRRYVAELITEPISQRDERYSLVLRFWLGLVPGQATPVLLHKAGIRRWAHRPIRIGIGSSRSLYLRRGAGYLENQAREDVFTRLTIRKMRQEHIMYVGKQADMLDFMPQDGAPPPLVEFVVDPAKFEDVALMPMAVQNAEVSWVRAGLEPSDHHDIFHQLSHVLKSISHSLHHLRRVHAGNNKRSNTKTPPGDPWAKLASMPHPLHVEILSEKHFYTLARRILDTIGFTSHEIEGDTVEIMDAAGKRLLYIEKRRDERLTDALPPGAKGADQRIADIVRCFKTPASPVGTLIELPDYRGGNLRQRDPKQAIRLGMSGAGRVSKFFVPEENQPEGILHRLENASANLLRLLGYREQPYYAHEEGRALPKQLNLLGFWLFQLNKRRKSDQTVYLPVAVEVPYGQPYAHLIMPGPTGSPQRHPSLAAAIGMLAQWSGDYEIADPVIRFFHAVMEDRTSLNPTLLILSDAKLRRIFPELQDVSGRGLRLFGMLDDRPHVRVARLRSSEDGDAPFCTPPEPKSKYQGLYAQEGVPHVFFSLHNVGERRIKKGKRKLNDPHAASVNPSTVLIHLCNMQAQDDREEWAGVIHRLRAASSHTDIATRLPQPLHDVDALKDYIPRHLSAGDDEDLNALGDGDDEQNE